MPDFDDYFPFELGHGGTASSSRWRQIFGSALPNGVVTGNLNQLNPVYSSGAGTVTVDTGACIVAGTFCLATSSKVVTVTGNGVVVARLDLTTMKGSLVWETTQTEYPYLNTSSFIDMPIMSVISGVATDLRPFINQGGVLSALASSAPAANLAPSATINYGILLAHIPDAGTYLVEGSGTASVALDASSPQTLQVKLFANQGTFSAAPPGNLGPVKELDWPGGGSAGQPYSTSFSGQWPFVINTTGLWIFGWQFVAGSGAPTCKVLDISVKVSLMSPAIPSATVTQTH